MSLYFKKLLITLLILVLQYMLVGVLNAQENTNQVQLAEEYLSQGEIEKAKDIYKALANDQRNIPYIHNSYFDLLLNQEEFKEAKRYLKQVQKSFPTNVNYELDEGRLEKRQGNDAAAQKHFISVINSYSPDRYKIRLVANYFIKEQMLALAAKSLEQAREDQGQPTSFALNLASIYRMMNEKDKMINEYLLFIQDNPSNMKYVQNTLQNILTEPEEFKQLETLLLDNTQRDPSNDIYPQMLIWVYLQDKDFYSAFIQSRAYEKRTRNSGYLSMDIAEIALENKDYDVALEIYEYVAKQYPESRNYSVARRMSIQTVEEKIKNTYPVAHKDIRKLINDYTVLIDEFNGSNTAYEALRSKALLFAFYLNEKDSAVNLLNALIDSNRAGTDLTALSKLDLGDIYLLKNEPWEATLLYSQVEKSHKEKNIGHEAKLKNAKLNYYKGDFTLAESHLDILKQATTREISNDAIKLSVHIKNNRVLESDDKPMQAFAAADLLIFQNRHEEAYRQLEKLLEQYPRHSLVQEIHYKLAEIDMKAARFDQAVSHLNKILQKFPDDIYGDDALFLIAEINQKYLKDTEQAASLYRQLLSDYPGSIFVAEARKRFRQLRGDILN
ncbi:MAG: tetratricopeptide repeat protein [Cyclobacteriaceae bacterium]|nr:tetratricopeptide repeat protein [Cyclobacteriaceae bacterium]MCH8515311.1 tetratricopeptide repeat protein [Cyclobacteriaceae bacterium]